MTGTNRAIVAEAERGRGRRAAGFAALGVIAVVVLVAIAVVAIVVAFVVPSTQAGAPGAAGQGGAPGLPSATADPAPRAERTGIFTFGHTVGNAVPSPSVPMDASQRLPFEMTVAPDSFRIHIRNLQYNSEREFAAGVTLTGVWLGEGETDDSTGLARPTGVFDETPTELAGSGDVGSGGWVTDWITPDQYSLVDGVPYLLSMGWTAPAGATLATYPGLAWIAANGGSAQTPSIQPTGLQDDLSYFDISIEYSFSSDAPVLVSIGHSLNTPVNGKRALFPTRGEATAWPQQWAAEHAAVAVTMASSGAVTTDFRASSTKWAQVAGVDPQIVTIWAASNDLSDGHPFAEIQTAWLEIVSTVRAQWPDAAIYAMTEPPRGLTGGPESTRTAWNDWLRTIPAGLSGVIDADLLLKDPADPTQLSPAYSADGIHFSEAGHAVIAEAVPAMPPVTPSATPPATTGTDGSR